MSTLCLDCNNRASNWGYVKEYRTWYELFVEQATEIAQMTSVDPLRRTAPFEIELPYDVQPGRFVRQVLGMFLAVQATEQLFARHPALPELIGPDPSDDSKRRSAGLDTAPLRLYMSVCNANWNYLSAPMLKGTTRLTARSKLLWTPPTSPPSQVDEVLLLCVSPFAFVLTTEAATDLGYEISDWTQWSVGQRPKRRQRCLNLPTADQLRPVMRAMVYPADYIVH